MKKHRGEKMKKTLQELTTKLQTLCHEGNSLHGINVLVHDKVYKIHEVKKIEKSDETYFVIETEK